jgi:protein O-GlcNAc transferase
MKMSIDQALRKARSLSPAEAAVLYREMLERFPANKRVQAELEALSRPEIINPPVDQLDVVVNLYSQRQLAQARDQALGLLQRFPNSEILHNITGAVFADLHQSDLAINHYDRALNLAPDYFEASNNRGIALTAQNRLSEAIASFDRAISFNPNFAEAYMNRSVALRLLKRPQDALASGSKSIALDPRCAEAYNARGNALMELNRGEDALADYDTSIRLKPSFADAFVNRGNILHALDRPDEAIESYDRAIGYAPAHVEAHTNRGSVLRRLKRLDQALASQERAVELAPGSARVSAEVRYLQAHMCIWPKTLMDHALSSIGTVTDAVPPFYMLGLEDSPQRQLECAKSWAAKEYGAIKPADFRSQRPNGRIKIGYFSADFHDHATMHLMAGMLELHDRTRFEIHAFSYGPDQQDALRQRLLGSVDSFHAVNMFSDEEVANLARSKGIDIAVDLKGHTQDTRLGIFARRAAPVQVSFLGYPGTSGTDFIDYVIGDRIVIPQDDHHFYTEKVAYLPNSYQPNDRLRKISSKVFSRTDLGLPKSGFVFCCFNNNYKITSREFDIWSRLLKATDGSVLWLLSDNKWAEQNLRLQAEERGITSERLVFCERMSSADHLARHGHADLFLDTFNFNAHTTAADALWAGVPVITKLGSSFASRVAGSLLTALDMPELVARSVSEYENIALDLAAQPQKLATVKDKLRHNRDREALFDTERYTRDMENLFQRLVGDYKSPNI